MSSQKLAPRLHPHLRKWFTKTFGTFTDAQLRCVPAILDRQSILLTSPTGSGKTLAGFLAAISPFSFPIYASVIKEGMMLEDPAAAIERIYHEMYAKVRSTGARLPDRTVTKLKHAI